MAVHFNHTLIACRDKQRSSAFLAEILGLPAPSAFSVFLCVDLANGVSLDFVEAGASDFARQHYAFLISEAEFDEVFERITRQGLDYWADPFRKLPHEINTNDGGRGLYFCDPDGHLLEVLTRPYGSGGWTGGSGGWTGGSGGWTGGAPPSS